MVGPLNMLIQLEAVLRFLSLNLTLAFLKMASDWISIFKGPNVCAQRFSRDWLCFTLVCAFSALKSLSKETSGTQGRMG